MKKVVAKHKSQILFPREKLRHFLVLLLLYFIGLIIVLILRPGYLLNIIIVYFPGMIYSFLLIQISRKKIILFGLISILFIVPVEILARLTDSWDVLSEYPRILGIAPIENVVYAIVNIIYPITVYEYFYDDDRNPEISKRWPILFLIYLALFASVFSIYFIDPLVLKLEYWLIGLIIYIPIFLLLILGKRHIMKRLVVVGLTFGIMFGIHEVISMYLGHWWWPGEYMFPMEIAGYIYPVDDIIIWLVFSNIAVISGYELFWD